MAAKQSENGYRIVFLGSHKQPSYIVDNFNVPRSSDMEDGEILVKVRLATICPMDLLSIEGKGEESKPCVLGHEGIAEVISCKRNSLDGATVLRPGDRVVFCLESCGICQSQCCQHHIKYGQTAVSKRLGLSGTFSTHMVLRRGTQVVRVPPVLSDRLVASANCALATIIKATRCVTSSTPPSEKTVAVIQGCGIFGMYACAVLRDAGYSEIYCQDVLKDRLSLVPKFGGIPVLVNRNQDIRLKDWPLPGSVDLVIEVCDDEIVFETGLSLLKNGGTYLMIGLLRCQKCLKLPVGKVIKKCLTLKGVCGYTPTDLNEALQFLERTKDRHPYDQLLSPEYSLHDFQNALSVAKIERFHRVALDPSLPSMFNH